jgi:hypothetical protein
VTAARIYSLGLLAAGLTIGSAIDRPAPMRPRRADGGVVLIADLHVHAFPGDGVLPAWELRREAQRRGIDVIAVTNHNQSIAARLPSGGRGELPIVIRGQEITAPGFHLAAVGIRDVVDWRLPLSQVIDAVHARGGVAIAAHPMRESWRAGADAGIRALDGAEAVHTRAQEFSRGRQELRAFYRNARVVNPDLAPIGSSDFHGVAPLGGCRTYILADEASERGVLDAIRRGRTVASDGRGAFVGDPALVELARQADAMRSVHPDAGPWHHVSVAMVLLALGLLVGVK